MTLHILRELEQGSEAWLEARRGMLTASVIGKLLTPTLRVAVNDTSRALIATLAAERITGHVEDVWVSSDMARGTEEEPLARDLYAQHYGVEVTEVGFIVREEDGVRIGFSPDGLVGDDGLIEAKSRKQRIQVQTVISGKVPPENLAQMMAGLWVTQRDWCDFVSYSNGMHLCVIRVYPDPDWFAAIESAAAQAEAVITDTVATYEASVVGMPLAERRTDFDAEMVI